MRKPFSPKFFCVKIIFIALTSFAFADAAVCSDWKFAGWYGGGCFPDIQFDPANPNRLYLASDVAGIWRSDDLGENWRFINQGLGNVTVALIAIAPSDSRILYAGTKDGLYVSKNAGELWAAGGHYKENLSFRRPENYRSIAVSSSNPAVVIVGTASGVILYSEDFGVHWQLLGNVEKPFFRDEPITAIQWTPDGKYLYAASARGVVMFSFESNRWRFLSGAPSAITDLLILQKNPNVLYAAGNPWLGISVDAGKTWVESARVPRGASYRLAAQTDASGMPGKLWVAWQEGWRGGAVLTIDGGRSWIRANQKMFEDSHSNPTRAWAGVDSRVNSLQIHPSSPEILFRTDWWGVWRSDDGGLHWHEKIKGAANTVGSDIMVAQSGEVYVATMDNGLLRTTNGGKTYTVVYPVKGYRKEINGHVWRVREIGTNQLIETASPWNDLLNQVVIVDTKENRFRVIREGLPSKRPDVNTMWEEGYPRALAIDPSSPQKIYLGIDGDDGGGLYISNDSGNHWEYSKGQPACRRIFNALDVDPTNTRRVFWGAYSEGDGGGIYLSEDQGLTWAKVFGEMKKVFNIKITGDGVIYALGDNEGPSIYSSEDHGKNWKLLQRFSDKGAATAITLIPGNPKVIIVGTTQWNGKAGGGIYWSEDSGAHWMEITGDLPPGMGIAAMAFNPKEDSLYVTRYAGSVYKKKLPLETGI